MLRNRMEDTTFREQGDYVESERYYSSLQKPSGGELFRSSGNHLFKLLALGTPRG